jgi:hypothetical protein
MDKVMIRWSSKIPPTLPGGGYELSLDRQTWRPVSPEEVKKLVETRLVDWN